MSTLKNNNYEVNLILKKLFSDYDLSLVCISKCDEAFMKCVSTCSSSDCIMECNRASATCGNGKCAVKSYLWLLTVF